MNMNAVGIDVSKRKSTVAILRPGGKAVVKPYRQGARRAAAALCPLRRTCLTGIGYMWLIPKDAEKPTDKRRKKKKL